jgi:F-type H+-transporting ATPase subunit gamma
LIVEDFLAEKYDQVFLSYTQFNSMSSQKPVIRKLLPLEVEYEGKGFNVTHTTGSSVFSYEPDAKVLLDEIIPRFTAMQIYQAILSSQASEHAARMVAMKNASDNASNLVGLLQLEYNKIRQQKITSEMLDIVGGTINQK